MSDLEVFPGISIDPDVRFGEPCLVGTRIDVATIVGADHPPNCFCVRTGATRSP